ncbi:hypothetical protein ABG067_002329 [Albugo candida]
MELTEDARDEKDILVHLDNSRFDHQPHSSITSDTSNQMILHLNQEEQSRICLYALSRKMTVICEACFERYSDKGAMEKYYLNHQSEMRNMYVIYTSTYTQVWSSCKEEKICPSVIEVLSQSVGDLLKERILPSNANLPIDEELEVRHHDQGTELTVRRNDFSRSLIYPSACLKTQTLSDGSDNCWSCLTNYGGLVVMDRDERFIPPFEAVEIFHYRVIYFARNLAARCTCPSCGTLEPSTLCMSNGGYVYTPNLVIHNNYMMDSTFNAHPEGHSVCALAVIERIEKKAENEQWQTCFKSHGSVYKLSSIASLVYLPKSVKQKALTILEKCLKTVTVTEFRFMSDFMCQYEVRLAEMDLNLAATKEVLLPSSSFEQRTAEKLRMIMLKS